MNIRGTWGHVKIIDSFRQSHRQTMGNLRVLTVVSLQLYHYAWAISFRNKSSLGVRPLCSCVGWNASWNYFGYLFVLTGIYVAVVSHRMVILLIYLSMFGPTLLSSCVRSEWFVSRFEVRSRAALIVLSSECMVCLFSVIANTPLFPICLSIWKTTSRHSSRNCHGHDMYRMYLWQSASHSIPSICHNLLTCSSKLTTLLTM